MTALTENRYTRHRDGLVTAHPVLTGEHIYKGSLVCAGAAGYAVPGADTTGYTFIGIALEEADNTLGASGDTTVRVQTSGVFNLDKTGTIGQGDIGSALYIADDQTVGLAAATTEDIQVGTLEALDENGGVWVRIRV